MKSKLLFLSFLMLLMVTTNYAQSSASVSGIAVQGIARNSDNTALINTAVRFTFTIYEESKKSTPVHTESPTKNTDEFGVFSHTINIPAEKNAEFANKTLWLEIKDATGVISDEVFKQVPYAIAASNGVPTGSIMPFVGSTAPAGWVLCNGQALGPITGSENLALLIGANAPDLRGMFLRGAETNANPAYASNVGPALNTIQGEAFKSHAPTVEVTVNPGGSHTHTLQKLPYDGGGAGNMQSLFGSPDANENWRDFLPSEEPPADAISTADNHSHGTSVTVTPVGGAETRPVNYGVNYIIKL